MKGRIYVNNLTSSEIVTRADGSESQTWSFFFSDQHLNSVVDPLLFLLLIFSAKAVQIWWRSQDQIEVQETLLLLMRTDELLNKWYGTVNRLITEYRSASRSRSASQSHSHHGHSFSTGSTVYTPSPYASSPSFGGQSTYTPSLHGRRYEPDEDENSAYPLRHQQGDDDRDDASYPGISHEAETGTVGGLSRQRGDSEAASHHAGTRRSAPPVREPGSASASESLRTRARTEDTNGGILVDWRQQEKARQAQQPMPHMPRGYSTQSNASESSFGSGGAPGPRAIRQQSSSSNLRRPSEVAPASTHPYASQPGSRFASQPMGSRPTGGSQSMAPPPAPMAQYRNRSASSPNVYQPLSTELRPPLPTNGMLNSFSSSSSNTSASPISPHANAIPPQLAMYNSSKSSLANSSTRADDKRGSGGSTNTSVSIESQPYPTTPFGGPGLSIRHGSSGGVPISRQGSSDSANNIPTLSTKHQAPNTAIIKIHFDKNHFTISMDLSSTMEDVRDRVMKKGETFSCFMILHHSALFRNVLICFASTISLGSCSHVWTSRRLPERSSDELRRPGRRSHSAQVRPLYQSLVSLTSLCLIRTLLLSFFAEPRKIGTFASRST